MALDDGILSLLMLSTSGFPGSGAKAEFEAYAEGAVLGLKVSQVNVITSGAAGSPGTGKGIGAINPGPAVMAPLIQANAVGSVPPIPGGTPQPLQVTFFLALAQISTHLLTNFEVETIPADSVAAGVGIVTPGGIQADPAAIENFIILGFLKRGLEVTPSRAGMAKAVGLATQQILLLATMQIPIVGGAPATPSAPSAGTRSGVVS